MEGTQFEIKINGVEFTTQPDSGSQANLINEHQYAKLIKMAPETKLNSPKNQLTSITDHELRSIGVFKAEIQSPSF